MRVAERDVRRSSVPVRHGTNQPAGNIGPSRESRDQIPTVMDLISQIPGLERFAKAKSSGFEDFLRTSRGTGSISVISQKGGVGVTTVSSLVAMALSELSRARVALVDSDPDTTGLSWLLAPEQGKSIQELSRDIGDNLISSLDGLGAVLSHSLEVFPCEMNRGIDASAIASLQRTLAQTKDVTVFDLPRPTRSVGRSILGGSDVTLLVFSSSIDSVRAAERTLDWLVRNQTVNSQIIAVLNASANIMEKDELNYIEELFLTDCDDFVSISWDQNLAQGNTALGLNDLFLETKNCYVELAAKTMELLEKRSGFSSKRRPKR